jgi:general secretion pathway protein D
MRERARAASAPPALINPNEVLTGLRFTNASLKDVLAFIGTQTGINVTYDREVQDRPVTVQLDGVTLEQALNQIMAMNQLSYKVVSDRSIFVFPDTPPKHAQYDEQVVRTFYLANADPTEISQLLSVIIRLPGIAVQPAIAVNKTTNTLTVRATAAVVQILEKIIEQNDKPRAEIVVDVEILEVDRNRVKNYGINLSSYNPILGAVFSPEVSPTVTTTGTGGSGGTGGTGGTGGGGTNTTAPGGSTAPGAQVSPPLFNLNTITRGFSSTDFYLAVPTALVRFLESDSKTKVVAKPQLRGAEGTKLSFAVGDQIPIVSTSYTPIATGGAGVNPLSSYQYKDVGVKVEMTPRVTVEGDVILDITLEDNQLGADKAVAGVTVPSFVQRTVTTRLRLRDGESNLLAGLIQEREQSSVSGFPGAIHLPFFKQVFSQNATTNDQVEIVMLLTPHIVRTQELTENDLKPIYIGSQQNLGVGGPPPLIAAPPPLEPPPAPPAAAAPGAPGQPGAPTVMRGPGGTPVTVAPPPGSTPVPGTVLVPPPAPTTTPPPAEPVAPPATPTPAAPAPPGTAPPATTPQTPATTPPGQPTTPPESTTSSGIGQAQIIVSPSGTTFRVGGGPYVVPISISGATRLSTITLTITFDATKLRVRTVQEGSFMRAGGVNVTFGQQVSGNRIDITLTRAADATGASGTGLVAAILFDAIAPGEAAITTSGTATGPGATPMGLRFTPVTVTVQP